MTIGRQSIIDWGKRAFIAGFVVVSLAVLFSALTKDAQVETRPAMQATVKRVRSGDTVKIDPDDKLVYAGIRAPQEGEPLFEVAVRRNAALVAEREVRLRFDDDTQDYKGRLLAYVFAGDQFVNVTLVREGLAFVRLREGERRFAAQLLAAQTEARRARRGIWSKPQPDASPSYAADPKYGEFHRPECTEVGKMKPERRVDFESRDKLLTEGFAPCVHCKP